MIKIAIRDDEKYYLDKIEKGIKDNLYFQGISQYEINTYSSGQEFYRKAETNGLLEYDVIFLGINVAQINGLEIAEKIREKDSNVLLVFVTAFMEHSLEGYKFEATRFLIKSKLDDMLPECVETIIRKLKMQGNQISFTFLEGEKELFRDQIYFIESQKHKLIFHIEEPKLVQYSLYGKLDHVEDELSQFGFLRIHKSYLVNLKEIKEIANYKVKLKDGKILPVPREKYQRVKEKYYELMSELL